MSPRLCCFLAAFWLAAAAHAAGMVHRDVKPANIWLEGDLAGGVRRCRLLDFGIAHVGDPGEARLTGTGTVIGTPEYMPLEQARGERVDHRADLYSLGIVLYRMATGTNPFSGPSQMAVLINLATLTPPPPPDATGEAGPMTRIAIYGFGRIGRNVLRALLERDSDLDVVAVNDLTEPATLARLLAYDTTAGRLGRPVTVDGDTLVVDGRRIKVLAERDPAKLPWKDLGVDIALECTGIFTSKEKASAHLTAGAKKVLISAPADGAEITVVYGVNHKDLKKSHKIVSNGSCTTNCLAPVAQVLNAAVGIERGYMTTIHSYTGDQNTVDTLHKDARRARAAGLSMIPTSTGAAKALGLVLPELKGKLDGTSIRVPTANVSVIDLVFTPKKATTVEEVNAAIIAASKGPLKGILGTTNEELVSVDFNHNPASSTFDLTQTQVIDGKLVRILSWYDNEWGFSNRMGDTAAALGKLLK